MINVIMKFSGIFNGNTVFFHQFGSILEGFLKYKFLEDNLSVILKPVNTETLAYDVASSEYLQLILKIPKSSYSNISTTELSSQICELARTEVKEFFKESEITISCDIKPDSE